MRLARLGFLVAFGAACAALAGCGGSATPPDGAPPRTALLKLDILWGARSRSVVAPSSALSAVVRLERGAPENDAAIVFPAIDRGDAPGETLQNWTAPTASRTGSNLVRITFHAEKGGRGAVVGEAAKSFLIGADGTGAGTIATNGKVQSVSIAAPASLKVGKSGSVAFTARDGNGKTLAITPGSAQFQVTSGNGSLSITEDGTATGLAVGTGTVVANVDGKISEPATLPVTAPDGAVAVIAAGQALVVGQSKTLVTSVTDAEGNAVPVDPASRRFDIVSGSENIDLASDGRIEGRKVGTTTVVMRIGDTLASEPAEIVVRPASSNVNVRVAPLQDVAVGASRKLTFTAVDAQGNALPIGAGGVVFSVVSGGDALTLAADGNATGRAVGVAFVTARVDQTTSPVQAVLVGTVTTAPSGLKAFDRTIGNGGLPEKGNQATVHYDGYLLDGTKFDSSRDRGQPFAFRFDTAQVIKGFDEGIRTLRAGGRRFIVLPPDLAYGSNGSGSVPPDSTLIFDVELLRLDP